MFENGINSYITVLQTAKIQFIKNSLLKDDSERLVHRAKDENTSGLLSFLHQSEFPVPNEEVIKILEERETIPNNTEPCKISDNNKGASKDKNIPCSSSDSLLDDIKKSSGINNKRVEREILQYMKDIGSISTHTTTQTVKFLSELLVVDSTKNKLFESIIFYPFLIRDNEKIIQNGDLNDFKNFKKEDLKDIQLTGIIWSFNENIDDFCINLYDEAIGELSNDS